MGPTSKEERVACLKSLGSRPDSAEPTEDGRKCQSLVVEALVRYSKGREGAKVFPYGGKASKDTDTFLDLPSTTLSVTLSCMYPFIVEDKETWTVKLKNCLYPIKQLWPMGILKRYIYFNDKFTSQREEMFRSYQRGGGVYHGVPERSSDENHHEDEEKEYEDVVLDCDKDFL